MVDYIAELRRRSEHCNYGSKLDEHLRDRLICGVKNNRIQRRLLSEDKLTLKRAIECGNNGHEVDKCRWKKCICYIYGKL